MISKTSFSYNVAVKGVVFIDSEDRDNPVLFY